MSILQEMSSFCTLAPGQSQMITFVLRSLRTEEIRSHSTAIMSWQIGASPGSIEMLTRSLSRQAENDRSNNSKLQIRLDGDHSNNHLCFGRFGSVCPDIVAQVDPPQLDLLGRRAHRLAAWGGCMVWLCHLGCCGNVRRPLERSSGRGLARVGSVFQSCVGSYSWPAVMGGESSPC